MYLTSALVAGAWALQASAFLVPLEVSRAAEHAKAELASLLSNSANSLDLDCPGCPYFGNQDLSQVETNVESKIHLEFAADSHGGLILNGFALQPDHIANGHVSVPTVSQIRVEDGESTQPLRIDFTFERLAPIKTDETPDVSVTPFLLTILALEAHPVKVDTVSIHIIRSPGQTALGKISTIRFQDSPGAETCDMTSRWSICRSRAIVVARLKAMMEAAKARAHGFKQWANTCSGRFGLKGGPPGMRHGHGHGHGHPHHSGHGPHGAHRHHYYAHRYGRFLYQTLRFFVIPALLGVIGGLVASAIGMVVGQCIIFVWTRYHRRGRRGDAHGPVVEIAIEEDEKDTLLSEEDLPPPQYHDLDVEAVVVDEEKK